MKSINALHEMLNIEKGGNYNETEDQTALNRFKVRLEACWNTLENENGERLNMKQH